MARSEHRQTPRWGNEARDRKAVGIWTTLEKRCGPAIADGAWLDVGCGSGGIASTLAPMVFNITGVDPEPWEGWQDACAEHLNLHFLTGAFDDVQPPVSDASIDVAICNQVYEHVSDPVALLQNIHRVLVPGGVCYFAGPNLLWPVEPHVFWPFVHWLPRRTAHTLMRALGSTRAEALDAWSTHYWRLSAWFRQVGFTHESAVSTRLQAALTRWPMGARVLRVAMIASLVDALAPFAPGFVFILRKGREPGGRS